MLQSIDITPQSLFTLVNVKKWKILGIYFQYYRTLHKQTIFKNIHIEEKRTNQAKTRKRKKCTKTATWRLECPIMLNKYCLLNLYPYIHTKFKAINHNNFYHIHICLTIWQHDKGNLSIYKLSFSHFNLRLFICNHLCIIVSDSCSIIMHIAACRIP